MKSQRKKIRHKLLVTDTAGDWLLGLVTTDPDYKTSLLLNSTLNIRLKASQPVTIESGDNGKCSFSRFTSLSETSEISYFLVANKAENCLLNRQYPAIDYFLLIRGNNAEEQIIEAIRKTVEITAVFRLELGLDFEETISF